MSACSQDNEARSSTTKARLTNGNALHLGKVDGRSPEARRWRDLYIELVDHLGGQDHITFIQRVLVRRAVSLMVNTELLDSSIARGEPVDPNDHVRLGNTLNRLLQTLGLIDGTAIQADDPSTLQKYLSGQGAGV